MDVYNYNYVESIPEIESMINPPHIGNEGCGTWSVEVLQSIHTSIAYLIAYFSNTT